MTQIASIRNDPKTTCMVRPRSDLSVSSRMSRFLMHGSTGTDNELVDSEGLLGSAASPLIMNNNGDWTTTPGWLGCDNTGAAGACAVIIGSPTEAQKAFVALQNDEAIILLSAWVNMPATISNSDFLFSYGNASSDDNAWGVEINSAGKTRIKSRSGGVAQTMTGATDIRSGGVRHVAAVIDTFNSTLTGYLDSSVDGTPITGLTKMAAAPGQDKIGVMLECTAASGTKEFGEGDVANPEISELTIIRFDSDVSSSIADIITGLYQNRGDLPWALDGL